MKATRVISALVMTGVLTAACATSGGGGSGASSSGKVDPSSLNLAYANVTNNSTLFNAIQNGYKSSATAIGAKLNTYDNELSGTKALTNAQLMVAAHPDLAFEYNVVAGLGKSLGTTFSRANVPCIAVNVAAPPCALENLNNPQLGQDTATVVGQYMTEHKWTGSNTMVIIAQNATAGTDVNSSVREFYSKLATLVPDMTKVSAPSIGASTTTIGSTGIQVDTKGTLDGAFAAVKNVLQGVPSSDNVVLYANNDDETLGGWRAVVDSNRQNNAVVAGLGGSEPALQQLRSNAHWIAEGMLFAEGWGEVGMAMAVAMLQGATPPPVTYVPQKVLTKQNVSTYFGSSNTKAKLLSALPSADDYLLKTGILQKFHNIEGVK